MAELATIARPYAEALFKADGVSDAAALAGQIQTLSEVAAHPELRRFAESPKITDDKVFDVIAAAFNGPLMPAAGNLLRTVVENGRLAALPEIARQFQVLVNSRSGVSDALVYSAYDIAPAQLADVVTTLETRFKRKLNASVVLAPELIGGIRVVVGDEVLDTSVLARLSQMKVALSA